MSVPIGSAPNPWPQLESRGLLGDKAPNQPLGSQGDRVILDGLRAAVDRVQAAGWTFERKRVLRVPGLMKPYVPLATAEVMEILERQPARFPSALYVNGPTPAKRPDDAPWAERAEHVAIGSLQQLRDLDALHGLAEAAGGPAVAALRACQSLTSAGWVFTSPHDGTRVDGAFPLFERLQDSNPRHQGKRLDYSCRADLFGANPKSTALESTEDLVALEYFQGSGKDFGLTAPTQAAAIKQLKAAGHAFWPHDSEIDAYQRINNPHSLQTRVGNNDATVPLTKENLASAALEDQIRLADSLYQKIGKPALELRKLNEYKDAIHEFLDTVLTENPRFDPQMRAAVWRDVYGSQGGSTSGRYVVNKKHLMQAGEDTLKLLEGSSTPLDLMAQTLQHTEAIRAARLKDRGRKTPRAVPTREELLARLQSNPLQASLPQLIKAMGSVRRGVKAATALEKASASEPPQERVGLFLELAEVLALHGEQKQAVRIFPQLQKVFPDNASRRAAVMRLGEKLVLHKSVNEALAAALKDSGVSLPKEVTQEKDFVVLGGIRVAKNQP